MGLKGKSFDLSWLWMGIRCHLKLGRITWSSKGPASIKIYDSRSTTYLKFPEIKSKLIQHKVRISFFAFFLLPHCIWESNMSHQHLYRIQQRKFSQASPFGCVCSIQWGLIWKRGLSMCHQCFHLYVKDIGFIKQDQKKFLEWIIQDIYHTWETMLAFRTQNKNFNHGSFNMNGISMWFYKSPF